MPSVPQMIAFGALVATGNTNSNAPNITKNSIGQGLGNGSTLIDEIPRPPSSSLPQIHFEDNTPRELSAPNHHPRQAVMFDHSQQYFPNLLRQYAHEHNISFNEHANPDELITLIQKNVPEGQKLPDWLIACTAKNDPELHLKQLLTDPHELVNMAGQSPKALKGYLEEKTGLTLDKIQELMTSEEFLIPNYILGFRMAGSVKNPVYMMDTTRGGSGKGLAIEVGYTHAFAHLLHLMYENKNSSISENLFRSMCPNPIPGMRDLVGQHIRHHSQEESTYVERYYQGKSTWAGRLCFRGDLMRWAIGTGSDYVLDVVCDSGYSLEERDVLSAPKANRYAWEKLKKQSNMSDEEALERIKEYLSKRDNSRDLPDELKDEPVAAIELLIETSIDIAYKNKAMSQEERDQIKKMVAENGDKINHNNQLILGFFATGTVFTFTCIMSTLKKLKEGLKNSEKQLQERQVQESHVFRQPLLPTEDGGMELAQTLGNPAS
jgi:hypothetical protein